MIVCQIHERPRASRSVSFVGTIYDLRESTMRVSRKSRCPLFLCSFLRVPSQAPFIAFTFSVPCFLAHSSRSDYWIRYRTELNWFLTVILRSCTLAGIQGVQISWNLKRTFGILRTGFFTLLGFIIFDAMTIRSSLDKSLRISRATFYLLLCSKFKYSLNFKFIKWISLLTMKSRFFNHTITRYSDKVRINCMWM